MYNSTASIHDGIRGGDNMCRISIMNLRPTIIDNWFIKADTLWTLSEIEPEQTIYKPKTIATRPRWFDSKANSRGWYETF